MLTGIILLLVGCVVFGIGNIKYVLAVQAAGQFALKRMQRPQEEKKIRKASKIAIALLGVGTLLLASGFCSLALDLT